MTSSDTLALYNAIVAIGDADPAGFWSSMPLEVRPEALACIHEAATKLAVLSAAEQLARIVRAAPGRRS